MRFSIIIPVYNVEKYIDRCMDTVMHQTFEDYEVIVVNDETPDNSMAIVQNYVDAFPGKIQVIHQKNTRQGGARNNGVSRARGEYLLFVDSDDYVALNMLETADRHLRQNPCDILMFHYARVTEQGQLLSSAVFDGIEPGMYIPKRDKFVVNLPTGPVCKAFRREFYLDTQVQFPEKLLYEDSITRLFYAMASGIYVCGDVLYYYVQSPNSSIRRNISEKMLDILTMTDIVIEEFRKRNLYEPFRDHLECALIYGVLYILDLINAARPDHPMQRAFADYLTSRFPDYRNNPEIGKTLCKALDYLTGYEFRKYYYRILLAGRIKEKILSNPLAAKLNELRRR